LKRFAVIAMLALASWPGAAEAYWKRSHWAACSEAPTEIERVRLNCYIFAPAYDWPLEYGGYGRSPGVFQGGLPPAPPPPRVLK